MAQSPRHPSTTKWGVYDTHDSLWMGNEKGPLCYGEFVTLGKHTLSGFVASNLAADLLNRRFNLVRRFLPRPLPADQMSKVDEVTPIFTSADLDRMIEKEKKDHENKASDPKGSLPQA